MSARLRLFEDSASAIVRLPTDEALHVVLMAVSAYTALEHAALLHYQDGAYTVRASRGALAPRGTRLSARAAYVAVLSPPLKPLLRANITSPLMMTNSGRLETEWLFPLAWAGTPKGLLVLASRQTIPPLSQVDSHCLAALGAILVPTLSSTETTYSPKIPAPGPELEQLTPRERQVLVLLPRGLTNAGIATELGIAAGTVKVHVEQVLRKLGVRHRTQAAVIASRWGLGI